jgi:two-component system, chemotaxis family, CheB/CheR fusion protein
MARSPITSPGRAGEDSPLRCPVVGVGASAGGLEAFRELFSHLPRDIGAAFVLVQHLAPDRPSHLPDILAQHTALAVCAAEDGLAVKPNRVYVAPGGTSVLMEDGALRVAPMRRDGQGPIDAFLASLARDQGELAVAVILSGSGRDGADGARAVEDAGGVALVQAPETAEQDGMPRAALASGLARPALSLPDLARTLVRHVAVTAAVCQGPHAMSRGVGEIPPEVWTILRQATGRDLCGYKAGTVARRIARRMQELDVPVLSEYLERLRGDPEEPNALLQHLLIGVTAFFRDEEVFAALDDRVLPRLAARPDARELRAWVAGCATGEEAYSIAILAHEACARAGVAPRVQVFATDLDGRALEVARAGRYTRQACARIPEARLARWFTARDDGFVVTKELRESCLFSLHHVTGDPPFSRLDLVSCRNVLIYLENELKRLVLPVFHYALRPGGVLLLGPSEGLGGHDDLFAPLDAKLRIFERKDTPPRPPPRFRFSVRGALRPATPSSRSPRPPKEPIMKTTFEQILLRELSPACAFVDAKGEVLHLSGPVGRFLEPPQGPATNNVVDLAREGLRLELRTALHKAVKENRAVLQEQVAADVEGHPALLDLLVRPVGSGASPDGFMVVFRERGAPPPGPSTAPGDDADALVARLRGELRATKEHLQTTIEELESSNAQLKVSNDELVTVNEELQSANEELQTSQEELQSLNEELETLNAELSGKVEELDRANADLTNLLRSTEIAAVFLGRDLSVKRFTPAATQLFRLIDADVGRPITDLASRFNADLLTEVSHVLRTLSPRERQVQLEAGPRAWYLLRVLPYVTSGGAVDGVVATFHDVTELKRAEEAIRESERRQREILETIPQMVWTAHPDGSRDHFSRQWLDYTGLPLQELLHHGWLGALHPDDREPMLQAWRDAVAPGAPIDVELRLRRADGVYRWFKSRAVAVRDKDGAVARWIGSSTDIDDLKRTDAALRASERRFRAAMESFPGVFVIYDADRRVLFANDASLRLAGGRDLVGLRDEDILPAELRGRYRPHLDRAITEGVPQALEVTAPLPGGDRHFTVRYVPLLDARGRTELVVLAAMDITERQQMEEALREADRRKDDFLALLGHELRNPLSPLRNAIELLRRRPGDVALAERSLPIMHRQVAQLSRLVEDLLDVERIARGKIALRRGPVDLTAVVRGALEDDRALFAEAGLTVHASVPAAPLLTEGDEARLAQAVGNVLANAAKFTDAGGEVHVVLREAPGGRAAELSVRDSGIGIDPSFLARVFDPFAQADVALDRRRPGLGLGLALVRAVVELHGGTARVTSAGLGQGTEIVLQLPLRPEASPARAEASPARAEARSAKGRAALRVLLVDDNLDAVESLAELLELEGHEVKVAADGASGLAQARAFRPDVVVCDIGLPGELDGYAVARAIRADATLSRTYLVALTGYASADHQRRAREAGFDRHLAKPPALDVLEKVLAELRPRT